MDSFDYCVPAKIYGMEWNPNASQENQDWPKHLFTKLECDLKSPHVTMADPQASSYGT